jgi:hypothetical protein
LLCPTQSQFKKRAAILHKIHPVYFNNGAVLIHSIAKEKRISDLPTLCYASEGFSGSPLFSVLNGKTSLLGILSSCPKHLTVPGLIHIFNDSDANIFSPLVEIRDSNIKGYLPAFLKLLDMITSTSDLKSTTTTGINGVNTT